MNAISLKARPEPIATLVVSSGALCLWGEQGNEMTPLTATPDRSCPNCHIFTPWHGPNGFREWFANAVGAKKFVLGSHPSYVGVIYFRCPYCKTLFGEMVLSWDWGFYQERIPGFREGVKQNAFDVRQVAG